MSAPPDREFLGVGWAFPLRPNPSGGLSWAAGTDDIRQAIWIILSTAPGERVMLPGFGCGIQDYVFAPNDPITQGNVAHQVRQALTDLEPRIDVLDVQVQAGAENVLLIEVDYRVRATNASQNLVYPFYLSEGPGA
jgi:phage baseplate assembly protein W